MRRKRLDTSSDPQNDSFCGKCNVKLKNGDTSIQCDRCNVWFHDKCVSLTNTEINNICKLETKGVYWYCAVCDQEIKSGTEFSHSNSKLEARVNNLDESIKRIESMLSNKFESVQTSYASVLKETEAKLISVQKKTQNLIEKQRSEAISENRKLSAIVFNLAENDEKDSLQDADELFSQIALSVHPTNVLRLGRKIEDKIRPLKISFESEFDKWKFLKRLNAIKPENVFGKLDLTESERKKESELYKQLLQYREENPDKKLKIKNMEIHEVLRNGNTQVFST